MAFRADKIAVLIILFLGITVSVEIGSARDVAIKTDVTVRGTTFRVSGYSACCNELVQSCCTNADSAPQQDPKSADHKLGIALRH
ncbi:unnamed protein product [Dovyalis caffra]|uniref:Uncharacterized protein n=1 Tax=Dovyalis caffra TaxID=77055 RepID=A0AAV1RSK2_9ROSI|nr:unnamed protein product [Dovyalis caffra]